MENKVCRNTARKYGLDTPVGAPFNFNISITEEKEMIKAARSFEVTGQAPETGLPKTCFYQLPENTHQAYLDFFAKLAIDFGLRLPQNHCLCVHLLDLKGHITQLEIVQQSLESLTICLNKDRAIL